MNDTGHPVQHVDGARPLRVHSQLSSRVPGLSRRRRCGMRAPSRVCSYCDGAAERTRESPHQALHVTCVLVTHAIDQMAEIKNASGDVEACMHSVPVLRYHLGHPLFGGAEKLGDSFQPLRGRRVDPSRSRCFTPRPVLGHPPPPAMRQRVVAEDLHGGVVHRLGKLPSFIPKRSPRHNLVIHLYVNSHNLVSKRDP